MRSLRPEIQALRACAVLLVVVYHLWPSAVPGGFIGVDVFFAISGFLITSHLLREVDDTGTVSLRAFWARRARRILPAALVTLLVCAVMTLVFVPLNYWEPFFADVVASTAYSQNWHLASTAVDYFAATDAPSPVRHFWSLSSEEQFYLVWPALIVLAAAVVRHARGGAARRSIGIAMGLLTVLSLVYSIRATAANPTSAYFVTPARAWEFGAGGMLALPARSCVPSAAARTALSWAGIAAILIAAFAYTDATPFPGIAALLPVAGALAVMRAGAPEHRLAATPALRLPPVQFLGDVSYAVYLWHWPLIVLAPFVTGAGVQTDTRIAILMLTPLAAWLTKLLVEDPLRRGRFLIRRKPRWTFSFVAAGMAVLMGLSLAATAHVQAEIRVAQRASSALLAARPACFGAAARDASRPCDNPKLRYSVVPTPVEARRAPNAPCRLEGGGTPVPICHFGVPAARATATIALIGDSHAGHWRAAVDAAARARGWHGISLTHHGCPLSAAVKKVPEPDRSQCVRWNRDVPRWLSRHPEVKTIFVSQISGGVGVVTDRADKFAAAVDGYIKAWRALPKSVERIVVIRDTPKADGDTDACVQRAITRRRPAGPACAVPRGAALDRDPAFVAAGRLRSSRVHAVDLTPFICDQARCYPVVGGALVFKDQNHMTAVFAKTLGPYLGRALDRMSTTTASVSGALPVCFGAAARAPRPRPCRTPRRRQQSVVPTPAQAQRAPNAPCKRGEDLSDKYVCTFGEDPGEAVDTFALIGDSHAGHWRGALAVVAKERHWRGLSIGHSSCPLSRAVRNLPEPARSRCTRWKKAVLRWLAAHPEVSTVFVSQLTGGSGAVTPPGKSPFETQVAGYVGAWRALPPSVRHVIVIRDTPKGGGRVTRHCVERAMARDADAGSACAVPRRLVLDRDPAMVAAARIADDRVRSIDMTRFFCDDRLCPPVIGGALVLKDANHMTAVFARTLGPFLLERIDRLMAERV